MTGDQKVLYYLFETGAEARLVKTIGMRGAKERQKTTISGPSNEKSENLQSLSRRTVGIEGRIFWTGA